MQYKSFNPSAWKSRLNPIKITNKSIVLTIRLASIRKEKEKKYQIKAYGTDYSKLNKKRVIIVIFPTDFDTIQKESFCLQMLIF